MARTPDMDRTGYFRPQPEILDQDMLVGDVIDTLRRLKFFENEFRVLKIDRPTRDYILDCVTARHGKL